VTKAQETRLYALEDTFQLTTLKQGIHGRNMGKAIDRQARRACAGCDIKPEPGELSLS
jgi:hypothetical protein